MKLSFLWSSFFATLNFLCEILRNLRLDLCEVLSHIFIAFLKFLFGEFSNSTGHHALLVFEEAVRSTEEAIKTNDFLKESELGVSFLS